MTKQDLINTIGTKFPSNNELPISEFRDWFENTLIPALWREPGVGPGYDIPLIYGLSDPNENTPSEPFSIGWFYTQTEDGTDSTAVLAFYQYNGLEWVKIYNIEINPGGEYVAYYQQNNITEEQARFARANIGLDFNTEDMDPMVHYLLGLNS